MPYIKQEKRTPLDRPINDLHRALVDLELDDSNNNMEGNLNYTITRLLKLVYGQTTASYRDVNDVVGLLECIKLEFYRTSAAPYEDQKRFENGEVDANVNGLVVSETVVVSAE